MQGLTRPRLCSSGTEYALPSALVYTVMGKSHKTEECMTMGGTSLRLLGAECGVLPHGPTRQVRHCGGE